MKKSSVSRTQRFTYFQILYYALLRWTRTNNQILHGKTDWRGSKVHHNTELWTQLTENRWNSSGIFSQDSLHCSSSKESKRSGTKWTTQHNAKDELSSCRCSTTAHGDLKTMNGNVLLTPHSCLYLPKDLQQDVGHSADLDQKRSGIPHTLTDDQAQRKRKPSFPSHESVVSRNAEKQRMWTIINTLLCRRGYDWNCFSHNHFCQSAQYLRSSFRFVLGKQ